MGGAPAGTQPHARAQARLPEPRVPPLRLAGLAKGYGRHRVLDGVDLELAPGEQVALVGPNGSGKSTLLRLAATLLRPTAGYVEVAGHHGARAPEAARRNLSILVQEAPLYPELTAEEHVWWWGRAQGVSADPAAALADAGLAASAQRTVRQLSRGQRQRLALALALLPRRPLLLLDEPFTALDAEGSAWLQAELDARRGTQAVLVALHDERRARSTDRVLRLRDGRLEAA